LKAAEQKLDYPELKKDKKELYGFANPSPAIKMVFETLLTLLNHPDYQKIEWTTSQELMKKANFTKILFEMDKENIPASTLRKVMLRNIHPHVSISNLDKVS
jgi:hypothetical protein